MAKRCSREGAHFLGRFGGGLSAAVDARARERIATEMTSFLINRRAVRPIQFRRTDRPGEIEEDVNDIGAGRFSLPGHFCGWRTVSTTLEFEADSTVENETTVSVCGWSAWFSVLMLGRLSIPRPRRR